MGLQGEDTSKFTGHERDRNGRTDYMLGRAYGIDLRQFMSVDPARDGWNLYGYVGRNPIGKVDPTGRAEEPIYARLHDGNAAARYNRLRQQKIFAAIESGGAEAGNAAMEEFNEGLEGPAVVATGTLLTATVSPKAAAGVFVGGMAANLGQRATGETDREAMGGTIAGMVVGGIANRSGQSNLIELGILGAAAAMIENLFDGALNDQDADETHGIVFDEITVSAND